MFAGAKDGFNGGMVFGEFVGFIVGARAGGWDVDFLFWMENQACCVFHFDVSMVKHEEHTSCLVQ